MPRPPPWMAPTMLTPTSSTAAQLRPWEMKGYPEAPLVLLGKQKINLRAHPQGSGLAYLPLLWRAGVFGQEPPAPAEKPFPFSMCMPLLQPQEMLCPRSLLENIPCCSCCHGTTRGHQTRSLPARGEGPPRSPACSFWAGLHQADSFVPHPLEGSAALNHGKKEAFIFRSLQLLLSFLP